MTWAVFTGTFTSTLSICSASFSIIDNFLKFNRILTLFSLLRVCYSSALDNTEIKLFLKIVKVTSVYQISVSNWVRLWNWLCKVLVTGDQAAWICVSVGRRAFLFCISKQQSLITISDWAIILEQFLSSAIFVLILQSFLAAGWQSLYLRARTEAWNFSGDYNLPSPTKCSSHTLRGSSTSYRSNSLTSFKNEMLLMLLT